MRLESGEIAIDKDGAASTADDTVRLVERCIVEPCGQARAVVRRRLTKQLGEQQVLALAGLSEAGGFRRIIDKAGDLLRARDVIDRIVAIGLPPHVKATVDDVVFLDHMRPIVGRVLRGDAHSPTNEFGTHVGTGHAGWIVDANQGLGVVDAIGGTGLTEILKLFGLRAMRPIVVHGSQRANDGGAGNRAGEIPLEATIAWVARGPGAGITACRAITDHCQRVEQGVAGLVDARNVGPAGIAHGRDA